MFKTSRILYPVMGMAALVAVLMTAPALAQPDGDPMGVGIASGLAPIASGPAAPGVPSDSHALVAPDLDLPDLHASDQVTPTAAPKPTSTPVPVGGKYQAEKACYARLPNLPKGLYGMFGGYNAQTGVLVAAGGAEKINEDNTITYYQTYAIKLNSPQAKWQLVPYSKSVGYTQENDKGCREGAGAMIEDGRWLSVFGKDGCDRGRFETRTRKGGDINELTIGDMADMANVRWTPNVGAAALVDQLVSRTGQLVREFATWDTKRNRLIFGQGTFNDRLESEGQDEVYAGVPVGNRYQLTKLDPVGPVIPERRVGSCAAYVRDDATGVDGVLVLGGQEGAPKNVPSRLFNEVWWLDFTHRSDGDWVNITSRFANQKDMGGRREGACIYDTATQTFYSWSGRADASVPDGASHSSGAWRVNLAQLGDPTAMLTWERLGKDNISAMKGRRQIPSVWDRIGKRMFVLGGRNGITEYSDVWAIYPDVVGEACNTLDPFAPPPGQPTAVPVPTATPYPPDAPRVCPQITSKVDVTVLKNALNNPGTIKGWRELKDPSKPEGPDNPRKVWLSLQEFSKFYHPYLNALVFKTGCP